MDKIKFLRTSNNISQKELSDYLEVAQNTVSNWENDMRRPSYSNLKKIADYFNVPAAYLLEEGIYRNYPLIKLHFSTIMFQIIRDTSSNSFLNAYFLSQEFESLSFDEKLKILQTFVKEILVDEDSKAIQIIYYIDKNKPIDIFKYTNSNTLIDEEKELLDNYKKLDTEKRLELQKYLASLL